jgi:hypothetical protein
MKVGEYVEKIMGLSRKPEKKGTKQAVATLLIFVSEVEEKIG